MRKSISQDDVAKALWRLRSKGTKPTIDAIREELGSQGSKSTIVKFLRSLNQTPTTPSVSETGTHTCIGVRSHSDFIDRLIDTDDIEEAIQTLIVATPDSSQQVDLITDLCLIIKNLKLEVRQCHSEINTIRNLQKQAFETLRMAIRS